MLTELSIKNFAIIDNLRISFKPGLNILTGETGAGKSIIIDALNLVLGERSSSEFIRTGEKTASVESVFDISGDSHIKKLLDETGVKIGSEDDLIIKREINAAGKSQVYINGERFNVSTLEKIGEYLVDIHGQHDHQLLLRKENQMEVLDSFGNLSELRSEVRARLDDFQKSENRLEELKRKYAEKAQKEELLKFQIQEIANANLKPGEDEELKKEKEILKNSLLLTQTSFKTCEALYEGDSSAYSILSSIKPEFSRVASIDENQASFYKRFEEIAVQIRELAGEIHSYADGIDSNPKRLEEIEERIDFLNRLKRKYNASLDEILKLKEEKESELRTMDSSGQEIGRLEAEKERLESELQKISLKLSGRRKSLASEIEKKVEKELKRLKMEKARFAISFAEIAKSEKGLYRVTLRGIDDIEFLISPNPGEELKPLAKIASGGELSRVMLAIKSILAEADMVPVLIFDEIDSGIGGVVAEVVGEKLKEVAKKRQVLCITHLPQIAGFADAHFKVSKRVIDKKTVVKVDELDKNSRVEEIAKMLGGEKISEISRKHAREILKGREI